jgi:hypothetical protein
MIPYFDINCVDISCAFRSQMRASTNCIVPIIIIKDPNQIYSAFPDSIKNTPVPQIIVPEATESIILPHIP